MGNSGRTHRFGTRDQSPRRSSTQNSPGNDDATVHTCLVAVKMQSFALAEPGARFPSRRILMGRGSRPVRSHPAIT
jgi:hypothetical protein